MKTHEKNYQAGFTLIEYIVSLVVVAVVATMFVIFFRTELIQSSLPISRLQNVNNLQRVMENIEADYKRLNELNLRFIWMPATFYPVNSVVVPTANNGYLYIRTDTTGSGISGTSEPTTWLNSTVTDGSITWTRASVLVRESNTATTYTAGMIVVPYKNNGHYYKCTVGGTIALGTSEPTWLITPGGGPITDSGVTWYEAGTILARSDTALGSNTFLDDNIYHYLTTTSGSRYGTGYTVVTAQTKFIKFSLTNNDADATGTDENKILKVTIKNNNSAEMLTQLFTIR